MGCREKTGSDKNPGESLCLENGKGGSTEATPSPSRRREALVGALLEIRYLPTDWSSTILLPRKAAK